MRIITTLCGRTFVGENAQNIGVLKDSEFFDNATNDDQTEVGIDQIAVYTPE